MKGIIVQRFLDYLSQNISPLRKPLVSRLTLFLNALSKNPQRELRNEEIISFYSILIQCWKGIPVTTSRSYNEFLASLNNPPGQELLEFLNVLHDCIALEDPKLLLSKNLLDKMVTFCRYQNYLMRIYTNLVQQGTLSAENRANRLAESRIHFLSSLQDKVTNYQTRNFGFLLRVSGSGLALAQETFLDEEMILMIPTGWENLLTIISKIPAATQLKFFTILLSSQYQERFSRQVLINEEHENFPPLSLFIAKIAILFLPRTLDQIADIVVNYDVTTFKKHITHFSYLQLFRDTQPYEKLKSQFLFYVIEPAIASKSIATLFACHATSEDYLELMYALLDFPVLGKEIIDQLSFHLETSTWFKAASLLLDSFAPALIKKGIALLKRNLSTLTVDLTRILTEFASLRELTLCLIFQDYSVMVILSHGNNSNALMDLYPAYKPYYEMMILVTQAIKLNDPSYLDPLKNKLMHAGKVLDKQEMRFFIFLAKKLIVSASSDQCIANQVLSIFAGFEDLRGLILFRYHQQLASGEIPITQDTFSELNLLVNEVTRLKRISC